jgi:hypothetical protein
MIKKTKVREQLDSLPEEFALDELIEKLILIEKIERGLKQSENNEVISEDDLDDEIEKWFE